MALSQLYLAIAGDVITAARWNNEFGNIYTNGTDVAFPVTKAVSFAGFTLTLDAAGVSTVTSPSNAGFLFTVGSKSGAPSASGSLGSFTASTFTDTSTAASGTAALWTGLSVRTPTLAASALSVTTTDAASVYIEGAPTAGTNETLTNSWALLVGAGNVKFPANLNVTTNITAGSIDTNNLDPYQLSNLNLNVTMSASAVTIAVKTRNNSDPSITDKVHVAFRNATLGTSGTTHVAISSALSFTISAGSTLGTVSGQASRVYVGLVNNDGVAELFVYNPLSGLSLRGLSESALISTTAEGGSGAANSAQTAYSTIARSNKAIRLIGFFESTQATAGTWSTPASTIQELQPWMPRTGQIIGTAYTSTGAFASTTSLIPYDDTLPQASEGAQVLSLSYTPVSAINYLQITGKIDSVAMNVATEKVLAALFTSTSANAHTSTIHSAGSGSVSFPLYLRHVLVNSGMTSCQTRIGVTGNTCTYNSLGLSTDLAASMNTFLEVCELMI